MGAIAIREKLHEYIKTADDKKVKAIFTMLETEIDTYKMNSTDIEEYNKEIKESMKEIDKGNFNTHKEVESIIKKRYKKASMV
jgi:predicted transcriptional regulator